MKRILLLAFSVWLAFSTNASAEVEKYKIDTEGAHAFIQFRIKHLGYSWLYGRFNRFEGNFTIDRENLENSQINVDIDASSIDSNHAERDKHLRAEEFLNTDIHPTAKFVSTALELNEDKKSGVLTGDLTLKNITRPIKINVELVGEGKDPWGGYRAGFEGRTAFKLKDFGIERDLGPASTIVEMVLSVEGIKQ
ncbi:MAG: YceI family protein [Rickettsiales bacterium]|nr:YceI family protein [Pseudomonadota bacterium]MDA0966963.1 YceI family protein [Pseudomonadota bacterium]MDG4543882.1 YceI family protein [Rickettsiales bacterium]MDG4546028.1 YceI family protein [Rickettsiales bacterium]MDG4548274.1 YceI family protein [Rickettsiales bacterium]